MEKKNKKNYFLIVVGILFIIFLGLYFMDNLGYYNIATKNNIITEEKLLEFEKDIQNGEYIDIKEYVKDNTNYKNLFSNIGYTMSTGIDNVLNKGLKKVGDILKKLLQ